MADEKIITSSVFEQGITEIMQDIANNLYEFEEYTEEEVADLMDLSEEEVAELTRVINDTTVALNKVYSNKKVEDLLSELEVTCNKYADEKIGGLSNIHLAYVDSLPSLGEDNTIYILKSTTGGNDTLNLYNNGWISIGEFAISLDNYYDKAEVDALLNDKANANEVVSQNDVVSDMSNFSSSTVLSTAGLEVELNKKVNLDEVVKKTDISNTIDSTSTDSEIPTSKAVETRIKNMLICPNDKSPKEFAIENIKAGQTIEFVQWGGTSSDSISKYATYKFTAGTDVNWGVLVATIHNTNYVRQIKYCGFDRYREEGAKWGKWQKVCTTTVADVAKTVISAFEDETYIKPNVNKCDYSVKNGYCTIRLETTCIATSTAFTQILSGLPKPPTVMFQNAINRNMEFYTDARAIFHIDSDGNLYVSCNYGDPSVAGVRSIYVSFSYPVAE